MNYDPIYLERLASQFKILGDKTRLGILMLLRDRELPVRSIVQQMDTTQANISKHLKILYEHNIVKKRQVKSSVLYSIKKDCIFEICEILYINSGKPTDTPIMLDSKE
jgi:DNA-binding transcriptional ArsR family regulator